MQALALAELELAISIQRQLNDVRGFNLNWHILTWSIEGENNNEYKILLGNE